MNTLFKCKIVALMTSFVLAATVSAAAPATAEVRASSEVKAVAPRPVDIKNPHYPMELRLSGIEGEAIVDLLVDATGQVAAVNLVSASHPEFGTEALAAARKWTFAPATVDGKPVAARLQVPFRYVMPEVSTQLAAR